jgi:hypothetical protein
MYDVMLIPFFFLLFSVTQGGVLMSELCTFVS